MLTSGKNYPLGKTYLFCAESSYRIRRRTMSMNLAVQQALRALIAVLLIAGLWSAGVATGMTALPPRLHIAALLLLGLGVLFALLFRRVRSEDRITDLEAALCREQSARGQADHALAEADLLLARMAERASHNYEGDPAGQLVIIQAELTQIQQRCGADQAIRNRFELLRSRLDRLGTSLRAEARAAEPG
jgi:ABC-type nickel/cobalt efflux system permease component RcnA